MPNNTTRILLEVERRRGEKRYKRLMDSVMRCIRNQIKNAKSPSDISRILTNLINSKLFNELQEINTNDLYHNSTTMGMMYIKNGYQSSN